jgi:polysaccharide export outer membrane protein
MKIDRRTLSGARFFAHFGTFLLLIGIFVGGLSPAQAPKADVTRPVADASYLLSANDLIKMTVFEENDLETTVRISSDGTVTFPLIGAVKVIGKTPQAAAKVIRDLYAKDYLVNPQVNLTVMEYAKRRFIILGQVQRPGTFDMPDRDAVNLLQAIGMAGGYTRIADPAKITVKRTSNGKDTVIKINGKRMASGEENANFEVQPGDVINVGESIF